MTKITQNLIKVSKQEAQILINMLYFSKGYKTEAKRQSEEIKKIPFVKNEEELLKAGSVLNELPEITEDTGILGDQAKIIKGLANILTNLKKNVRPYLAKASVIIFEEDKVIRKEKLLSLYNEFCKEFGEVEISSEVREEYQKEMWKQASTALGEEIEYNYKTKNGKDKVDAYFLEVEFGLEVE